MNTYNTIILLHGEAVLTSEEFKEARLGDRIFGNDTDAEEIARWSITEEAAALAELKKHACEISHSQRDRDDLYRVDEYALEYCDCDADGEFICGSDFALAEQPPIEFTERCFGDSEVSLHIERSSDIDFTLTVKNEPSDGLVDISTDIDGGDDWLYYDDIRDNRDTERFAERFARCLISGVELDYLLIDQQQLIISTVQKFVENAIKKMIQ